MRMEHFEIRNCSKIFKLRRTNFYVFGNKEPKKSFVDHKKISAMQRTFRNVPFSFHIN